MNARSSMIENGRRAFWSGRRFMDNPNKESRPRRWWAYGFGLGASEEAQALLADRNYVSPRKSSVGHSPSPVQGDLFG